MARTISSRLIFMLFLLPLQALPACGAAQEIRGRDESVAHVEVGDVFTVELEANPSTGFVWEYEIQLPTAMFLAGHEMSCPESDPPLYGAPCLESWSFRILEKGDVSLRFSYSRPWEQATIMERIYSLRAD